MDIPAVLIAGILFALRNRLFEIWQRLWQKSENLDQQTLDQDQATADPVVVNQPHRVPATKESVSLDEILEVCSDDSFKRVVGLVHIPEGPSRDRYREVVCGESKE